MKPHSSLSATTLYVLMSNRKMLLLVIGKELGGKKITQLSPSGI